MKPVLIYCDRGAESTSVRHALRELKRELAHPVQRVNAADLIDGAPLKEAAALSGLSHAHLRWLARKGKLEATRMGRDWFTTEKAVDLYLKKEERKYDPLKKKR